GCSASYVRWWRTTGRDAPAERRMSGSSPRGGVMVHERQATAAGLPVELNGINVISEAERKGQPRVLFWPWCASNIAVLSISYGSFFLGFGVSFWQATIAGVTGIVLSFLLVGFVSLAGKRGSAPTMVLRRAGYGREGRDSPAALSV